MAERVGFEPTIPVKVYTLSKRAPSATRPSLRLWKCISILAYVERNALFGGRKRLGLRFEPIVESGIVHLYP